MKPFRVGLVVVASVVLTTLGISASDTLSGSSNTLLAQLWGSAGGACPSGMVLVSTATTFSCVDEYEARPTAACSISSPESGVDTEVNMADESCAAASTATGEPWRYVTRLQAELACVRAGKRLPTAEEWYRFALDTPSAECNLAGGAVTFTDTYSQCVSAYGVRHAVGNVWEWVADDVIEGRFDDRALPPSGYVAQVDRSGVATVTDADPGAAFGDDYFWSAASGAYGMVRGGFYDSGSDGGLYTVLSNLSPQFSGEAVGFRCVL